PCWRYIEDDGVAAGWGLAADEFLMSYHAAKQAIAEPTLRLYTYRSHCALAGRFQNIEAEIDLQACRKFDVQFNRRPTGGGAILMGDGQLGISFTAPANFLGEETRPMEIYRRLSTPLIQALEKSGIQARFRPKNDLETKGKKIAGLGVYFDPFGAMLFHASLLVDLDLAFMLRILKIPLEKISDKADTDSVAKRITTVFQESEHSISINEMRKNVRQAFQEMFGVQWKVESWNNSEKKQIEQLAKEKYQNEEWLFQRTPQPEMTGMSVKKTPAGLLRTYMGLKGEIIKSVLITGDFFESSEALNQIEAGLKWSPLEKNSISKIIDEVMNRYDANGSRLSGEEITEAVWKAGLNARAKNRFTNQGSCYYPLSKTPAEI
ncbi:lipoate--protein ligase, partial [bacterium]|nr:lipoate--protein ligase [bacterium]